MDCFRLAHLTLPGRVATNQQGWYSPAVMVICGITNFETIVALCMHIERKMRITPFVASTKGRAISLVLY